MNDSNRPIALIEFHCLNRRVCIGGAVQGLEKVPTLIIVIQVVSAELSTGDYSGYCEFCRPWLVHTPTSKLINNTWPTETQGGQLHLRCFTENLSRLFLFCRNPFHFCRGFDGGLLLLSSLLTNLLTDWLLFRLMSSGVIGLISIPPMFVTDAQCTKGRAGELCSQNAA